MITVAEPIDADTLRIRHEFLVAPDLRLSAQILARRLGVSVHHATAMLEALVSERFLTRTDDGHYVRCIGTAEERR